MKDAIGMERLYNISQFNSLRINHTVSEIPEELMFNEEFTSKLRFYQFLESERSWAKYIQLYETLRELDSDVALEIIENQRVQTLNELLELVKGDK